MSLAKSIRPKSRAIRQLVSVTNENANALRQLGLLVERLRKIVAPDLHGMNGVNFSMVSKEMAREVGACRESQELAAAFEGNPEIDHPAAAEGTQEPPGSHRRES
jgi:hypothetical protein